MTSSLECFFDSTLFINLERRVDRRMQIGAVLAALHFDCVQRVIGIDRPDNGNAGCTASHRALWRRIATGEFGDRVLVFEDDAMPLSRIMLEGAGYTTDSPTMRIFMSAPWRPVFDGLHHLAVSERFDSMVGEVPENWDVLYLGGQYQCDPRCRVSPHVIQANGVLGTVAYGMRRKFAQVITAALDQRCPEPGYPGAVDMVLTSFAREHNFYMFSPRLFIPTPGNLSDLQPGHVEGFPFAYTDARHERMV